MILRLLNKVSNNQFSWKTVIQESNRPIKSVDLINQKFVVNYLEDTLSEINFYNLDGELTDKLNLNTSISGFEGSIDDEISYFAVTDYVTPRKIYQFDFNGDSFGRKLYWSEMLDGYKPAEHTSRLTFYESKDGTKIPLNINYANNTDINDDTPVLLYGYGGFDISILPRLNKSFLAWMNQGGVVAIANLRGGGEYGEDWHRDGMLLNKQNVFAFLRKSLQSPGVKDSLISDICWLVEFEQKTACVDNLFTKLTKKQLGQINGLILKNYFFSHQPSFSTFNVMPILFQ